MPRSAIFLVLFSLAAVPARADWYITPFAGITFGTSTNFLDLDQAATSIKFTFGGQVTMLGPGVMGLEGDVSMVPGFFQRTSIPGELGRPLVLKSRVTTLTGNVVVAAPLRLGYGLRPYGSIGPGLMRASAKDTADAVSFDRNMFALSAGGGLIGLITDKRGLRFDVRYFRNIRTVGTGALGTTRASLGFWRGTVGVIVKR